MRNWVGESEWSNEWVIEWFNVWVNEWVMSERVIEWLSDSMYEWMSEKWMTERVIEWVIESYWVSDWMSGWIIECVAIQMCVCVATLIWVKSQEGVRICTLRNVDKDNAISWSVVMKGARRLRKQEMIEGKHAWMDRNKYIRTSVDSRRQPKREACAKNIHKCPYDI